MVFGIAADASWNAGSAICSPLSSTALSPTLLTVTVAACVAPTGTEPKDTESGFTVSGSVLYEIPQPVRSASRPQTIQIAKSRGAAERRSEERPAKLERSEKE